VERAILAGDTETGVCIMQLEEGLDTGPVYAVEQLDIGPEETADELRDRLVVAGTELLLATLRAGLGEPGAQEGEPTYASKIDPAELELDWTQSTTAVHGVIRLGRAWTTFRGKRLKVLRARRADATLEPGVLDGVLAGTGDGAVELVEVQPEGKGPQDAHAWRNGARPELGERFGS
jgi:methionyl-tRNA formyltransferase